MRVGCLLLLFLAPSIAFVSSRTRIKTAKHDSSFSKACRTAVSPLRYVGIDEEQREELRSKLPPVDVSQMSKLEIEFRELLEGLLYTSNEIESIHTPRMRTIYEGIAASYYEPAVYRAFEVLYEDYTPLRVAGRMAYKNLKVHMDESKDYKSSQIKQVLSVTEISKDDAEKSWSAFVRLAEDRELSLERAERYFSRGDSLNAKLWSATNSDHLTYDQLVVALCSEGLTGELVNILQEAQQRYHGENDAILDRQRAKHSARYDDMLTKFGEWKDFIPDGEGRRLDILRGCFVGSENPKVVQALRIIYTDNTALRLSGNWIFKVVSTIMAAALRRHKRRQT